MVIVTDCEKMKVIVIVIVIDGKVIDNSLFFYFYITLFYFLLIIHINLTCVINLRKYMKRDLKS